MQLDITENPVDPISGEIDFSVISIPLCSNETVPQDTMIASIQSQEEPQEPRILELRGRLQAELSTCSAQSMNELTPWKNNEHAFKIEVLDSSQKPINCKSRPLPFNLKNKVKFTLDEQLNAK